MKNAETPRRVAKSATEQAHAAGEHFRAHDCSGTLSLCVSALKIPVTVRRRLKNDGAGLLLFLLQLLSLSREEDEGGAEMGIRRPFNRLFRG
jgi:hypothetical protein